MQNHSARLILLAASVLAFGGPALAQGPQPEAVASHYYVASSPERTTLDRDTGKLVSTVDVTLSNLGGRELRTPLHAVIEITGGPAVVRNALGGPGDPTYGTYYLDLSADFPGGVIEANSRVTRQITFERDRGVPLAYEIVPYAAMPTVDPPAIEVAALVYAVNEGDTLVFEVIASDPDGEEVVLLADPSISNAVFAATSGVQAAATFAFSPAFDQAGKYAVTFTARDPLGLTDSETVIITVSNVNQAPLLAGLDNATVKEGDLLQIALVASDPDDDGLALAADPVPSNAVFAAATRSFFFAPGFDQAGEYDVAFSAADGVLGSATQMLHITVTDVPASAPGGTNELTLVLDPITSPTLLAHQRVSGAVNAPGGAPSKEPTTMALITGLSPANAGQGATLAINIAGQGAGAFATHFAAGLSAASFGAGITVNSVIVSNPTAATAEISIASDAAPGPRAVSVTTSNEVAVSLVALNVDAGVVSVSGTLVDFDTTNGIANALITLQGTGFSTISNPDGTFTINGLPPGTYTALVNPPNHQPFTMQFTAAAGEDFELGNLPTSATVFDPNAPASVSLLSILGRGFGDFAVADMEQTKQTIRDALLLTGGTEAGLLDEFGNQLNPDVEGVGLMSTLPEGVNKLAEGMDRGESISLLETIYPFTFTFVWTNGPPPTLQEWVDTLQTLVNDAWADPTNPSNALPLLVFNGGNTLSPNPPVLNPETRLNPAQSFLFNMSMLSFAVAATTTQYAALSPPEPEVPMSLAERIGGLFVVGAYAQGPPPPQGADRKWTSYWRGFTGIRTNFFIIQLNTAVTGINDLGALMTLATAAGGVKGLVATLPLVGLMAEQIIGAFANIGLASRVPEPPKNLTASIVPGANNVPVVKVRFNRSPSDKPGERVIYSLYRFRNFNEGRQFVDIQSSSSSTGIVMQMTDPDPFHGSTFYAATLTKLFGGDDTLTPEVLNEATPWFNFAIAGLNDPAFAFAKSRHRLVSDYSDPVIINVVSLAAQVEVNELELDPNSGKIFYADRAGTAEERKIIQVPALGEGDATVFAFTQFKDPGQEGLAVDKQGNVYSLNKGSDAIFGGRIFKFDSLTGAREFVGTVNYYSRDLQFANPVDAFTAAMGPGGSPHVSDEDFYTVDMLAGQVKRAPVKALYDPYRRVGQPYAKLPVGGRPKDIEVRNDGQVYLLMADARSRGRFGDREKGTMHIPPGAPLKKVRCPELEGGLADPVYPFSGEFYEDVEDIRIKGRGLDFTWTRKYRSKIATNTLQGNNWDYSYNISVEGNTNNGNLVIHDGHTRVDEYQLQTNGTWTLPEFFREAYSNFDGTITLEFEDKGRWVLNALNGSTSEGRIRESIDRFGNTLQFFHDGAGRLERVRDTLGRDIHIAYNGDNLIDSITDFAGRAWQYDYYDGTTAQGNDGDLKAVTYPVVTGTPNGNNFPNGKKVSYTYTKGNAESQLNGNLLTITDGRRNDPADPTFGAGPFLINTYATNTNPDDLHFDRVVRQQWGNAGDTIEMFWTTVASTPENGFAVVKLILNDRVGNVKESYFNEANQCVIMREYTGRANPSQFTTESQNRPAGKLRDSDPDHFETRYEWNADSLKTREIHPNGNITEWVYEGDLDPNAPARSRANVRVIRHLPGTHTPVGDQAVIEEAFEYDTSFGRGCCGFNFVTRQTDSRGNDTRKFYDSLGNLTSVIHRISSIREDYAFNSFGQMTRIVHPDNGSSHRRVDAFTFYGAGDGAQNGYMKEIIVDSANQGLTTRYEYDAVGNSIRVTDPDGDVTDYLHNQLSQVVRKTLPETTDGSGVRYQVDTFYDANNNVSRVDIQNVDDTGAVLPNSHITSTFQYDILNYLTRKTEEVDAGHSVVTEYQLDRNRNVILTRFGAATGGQQPANVLRQLYDERDKVYRDVRAPGDPAQSSVQYDYDPNGNLTLTHFGAESTPAVFTTTYDAFDRKVSEMDPLGNETVSHYDSNGLLVKLQKWGELADVPGSANNVLLKEMRYHIDPMDRLTNSVYAWFDPVTQAPMDDSESSSSREYNDKSDVMRVVDDNGHEVRNAYDTVNRLSVVTDHASNTTTHVYDRNNSLLRIVSVERSDLGGSRTFVSSNRYDNLGRRISTTDSGSNTTLYAYDSRNNMALTTDARGNRVRKEYDGLNRLIKTTHFLTSDGTGAGSPAGTIVLEQAWDDSSRLASQRDNNGNVTAFAYDPLNRRIAVTMPDGSVQRAEYDLFDNVVLNVDPQGTRVSMEYDELDRLLEKTIQPGPGVSTNTTFESYAYNGLSMVMSAEDDDSLVTRTYDSLSLMLTETINGGTTRFFHDGVENLLGYTFPGGRAVTNRYDALDRLKTVRDENGLVASYDYAGPHRTARRTIRNTTEETYQHDATKRVTRTTHVRDPGGAAVTLDDRVYTWDSVHNKRSRADLVAGVTNVYSYDSVDRLVRTATTGAPTLDYMLDGVGNRTNVTGGSDAGAYARSAGSPEPADAQVNQYTDTPFDTRTYNTNGNLGVVNAGLPDERRLVYDYRHQLAEYRDPGSGLVVTFAYDIFGRRVLKTSNLPVPETVRYFYEGEHVIEEQDASNATAATYVYGNQTDERLTYNRGGQDYYFHGDDLLNSMKITDAGGLVVEQYEYGDYGATSIRNGAGLPLAGTGVGNAYLFAAKEFDAETGLYHFPARYLDPRSGRFITRDPQGSWGDTFNLGNAYSYVGNNPWSRQDPTGMATAGDWAGYFAGVAYGGGEAVVAMAVGLVHLAKTSAEYQSDPLGFSLRQTQMAMQLMDEISKDPKGPASAALQKLCPEVYEQIVCLDHLTPFEKGRLVGRVLTEVITAAVGVLDAAKFASAVGRVGRVSTMTEPAIAGQKVATEAVAVESAAVAEISAVPGKTRPMLDPLEQVTFRGDLRKPDEIFETGFQPRGESQSLEAYVKMNEPSVFVGTSKSMHVARDSFAKHDGWVYTVRVRDGVDVNTALGIESKHAWEAEIAAKGGVPVEDILGARRVSVKSMRGGRDDGPTFKFSGDFIPNPKFKPD